MNKSMKKTDIKKLIKLLEEYKAEMLKNDPFGYQTFGYQNAVWASGYEYFLEWLSRKK